MSKLLLFFFNIMIDNKNNTAFINRDTFKVEFAPKKSPRKLKSKENIPINQNPFYVEINGLHFSSQHYITRCRFNF